MNTFLPVANYRQSALMLDNKRLGKQRVETLQLVNCIAYDSEGWRNHPATVMWRPYLDSLIYYGMTMCRVWQEKGFKDTVWTSLYMLLEGPYDESMSVQHPPWLGSMKLHSSHRSNLLRKDPTFYSTFNWTEESNGNYFWPSEYYDWRPLSSDREDRYGTTPT